MKSRLSTRVRIIPVTAIESSNFYFLVKVCGISPLDIPHMTPFQVETLIHQHNKHVEIQEKKVEEQKKKIERKKAPKRR